MTIYGPNLPHFQERQLNLYLLVDIISTTLEVLMMSFKIITCVSSIMLWTYGGGGRGCNKNRLTVIVCGCATTFVVHLQLFIDPRYHY